MSSSKYRHAWNRLHISFPYLFYSPLPPPPSNLEEGGMHCTNLVWTLYKYTCQRDICFLLSKVNNHLIIICLTCRHHQKYKKIYLNHWPKKLINKYIHYKSNVLSTFSWLEPVLTPALDIGIAKSGSNLVHSPPSHIVSHPVYKQENLSRCLTLSCDDVPSN